MDNLYKDFDNGFDLQIILARHGQSAANVDRRHLLKVPNEKVELTPKGWSQAVAGGKFLHTHISATCGGDKVAIFNSSWLRARQTTQGFLESIAVFKPYIRESDMIVEQMFGFGDGMTDEELLKSSQEISLMAERAANHDTKQFLIQAIGAEPRSAVDVRGKVFLNTLFRAHAKHNIRTVIIPSHGVTIRQLWKTLMNLPYEMVDAEKNPGNCDMRLLARMHDGKFVDYGWAYQNGKAQPVRAIRHKTTEQYFAEGAYYPSFVKNPPQP